MIEIGFTKRVKTETSVKCKTSFEGIHCYPAAPEEVAYLAHPHRHMFNVEVEMDVFDDDREVEFIMLKHRLNEWLDGHKGADGVWHMDTLSCEQVGKMIVDFLYSMYCVIADGDKVCFNERTIIVDIDEDGENGAIVYHWAEEK